MQLCQNQQKQDETSARARGTGLRNSEIRGGDGFFNLFRSLLVWLQINMDSKVALLELVTNSAKKSQLVTLM